jgi:hypothetical protein
MVCKDLQQKTKVLEDYEMMAQLKEKFSVVSRNAYRSSGIYRKLAYKEILPE